jgi:hypothetical protein
MNQAREQVLEDIRVHEFGDEDVCSRVDTFLHLLDVESQVDSISIPLGEQSCIQTIDMCRVFYALFLFFQSPSICTQDNCLNVAEIRSFDRVEESRAFALKRFQAMMHIFEREVGVLVSLFKLERVIGIPGGGKSSCIKLIRSALEGRKGVEVYEGGKIIKAMWPQRAGTLVKIHDIRLRLDGQEGADQLLRDRLLLFEEREYELYWDLRRYAAKVIHANICDALWAGYKGVTLIESEPYLAEIVSLGCSVVNHLLRQTDGFYCDPMRHALGLDYEIACSPRVDLQEYHPFAFMDGINLWCESLALKIRECLLENDWLSRVLPFAYGPTLVIDLPTSVCRSIISKMRGLERMVREKDYEYWGAWRLIYLILADTFPNIGILHAAFPADNKLGYGLLSEYQVASLGSVILAFHRVKSMIDRFGEVSWVSDIHDEVKLIIDGLLDRNKRLFEITRLGK